LFIHASKVTDLSPVRGMALRHLWFGQTSIKDLSPVQGMPLTVLKFEGAPIADLTPLRNAPLLQHLTCNQDLVIPSAEMLRSIKTLETINDKPAADVLKSAGAASKGVDDAWIKQVQALPADKQVEAVAAKLQELNPGFDGKVESRLQGKDVDYLRFSTDAISDISPVRALAKLRTLYIDGSGPGKGRLADLSPLAGLPIIWLSLHHNPIGDLTPLQGFPLQQLSVKFDLKRDGDLLRSIKSLKSINGRPVAEILKTVATAPKGVDDAWIKSVQALPAEKQVEAIVAKLQELNPGFDGAVTHRIENGVVTQLKFEANDVTNISPVRALAGLLELICRASGPGKGKLSDLSPLIGMKLKRLTCGCAKVQDLSPLKGLPLVHFSCDWTKELTDLSPLQELPLIFLNCGKTGVANLAPIKSMPLTELVCDFNPVRDAAILKSIKTLAKINGKPAAEFWKEVDGKQP
jgi:hypothetical protein